MSKLPKKKISLPITLLLLTSILGLAILWSYKHRLWDGKTRFTMIKLTSPLQVKSIDPTTHEGIILTLPDDLEIESVAGRGKWLAGMIGKAGKSAWVADSLADYLGISYQGIEGQLDWWDSWAWRKNQKNVSWREVNLGQTPYVTTDTTPDGVSVKHITSAWDNKSRDWFSDQTIARESLGVELANSSAVPGLGASAARVVESMGFKVRKLTSQPDEVDHCVVKSQPSERKTLPVSKLMKEFGCRWESTDQSDLILILGREYRIWRTGS
jgi:hypothetical protein